MGRHIICDSETVYAYKLGKQDSELALLNTVFYLGELEQRGVDYPIQVLHLFREDIAKLRLLLKSDDWVAQRIYFREMVQALIDWMEETGESSFQFESEG